MDLLEALRGWGRPGSLMERLGIRLVSLSPEEAVAEVPVGDGVRTPTGLVHAGALIGLADTAATWLLLARMGGPDPHRFPVAVAVDARLVGNTREGTLVARARLAHPGRRLPVVQTEVRAGERLLALVTTTHFLPEG